MSDRDVDAELVARVQKGDKRAFDLLVLKYQRKIMRLLARMLNNQAEIEDIAQETFIKAYRALPQFRGKALFIPGYIELPSIPPVTGFHPISEKCWCQILLKRKRAKLFLNQTIS